MSEKNEETSVATAEAPSSNETSDAADEVSSDEQAPGPAESESTPEASDEGPLEESGGPVEAEAAEPGAGGDEEVAAAEAEEPTAEPVADDASGEAAAPTSEDGDEAPAEVSSIDDVRRAMEQGATVRGKVFGWNPGGFHVVVGGVAAFCPRSEIEAGAPGEPESYVDEELEFAVLRIEEGGRRVVLSRAMAQRGEQSKARKMALQRVEVGARLTGLVTSLTDFGAFVDIGGAEGLVHVSEISRSHVHKPEDVLEMGQRVEVEVLKVERGGKRISLSMKALEADPWKGVAERYPVGSIVTGRVERTSRPGAFIELEPGLVGLLPKSEMNLPPEALPERVYSPGREVKLQIMSVDPRRKRVSLAPQGSAVGGSRGDYTEFKKRQEEGEGFNALAAAFKKIDS